MTTAGHVTRRPMAVTESGLVNRRLKLTRIVVQPDLNVLLSPAYVALRL